MDSFGNPSYQNGMETDFNKTAGIIGSNIQKISQNVSSMKKMVNDLGTPKDTPERRKTLHKIQQYTNNLARDTNVSLKELQQIPIPTSPTLNREYKVQKNRLLEEFSAALNEFQDVQKAACAKEREVVQRSKESAIIHIPPPPGSRGNRDPFAPEHELIDLQDPKVQRQKQLLQEEEMNLERIEEQELAIQNLERDINEVNHIFKEFGALVHDQGTIVDSIEASIEHSQVHTREGATHLRHANEYAKKNRRKICILAFIGATILFFLGMIIFWPS